MWNTSWKHFFLETLHLLWNKKCSFHPLNIALTFTDLSCSMWGFLFKKIPFHFFCCNLIFFFRENTFCNYGTSTRASFSGQSKSNQVTHTHAQKIVFAGSSFWKKRLKQKSKRMEQIKKYRDIDRLIEKSGRERERERSR